jgi:hypothetical protein
VSGTDSGFVVHPNSLQAFAATSDHRVGEFQQCYNEAKALTVGPDAFGHLPFVSDRARKAYEGHLQTCESSLLAAATTMHKISTNIRTTITNYKKADTEVEDAASAAIWAATNPGIADTS